MSRPITSTCLGKVRYADRDAAESAAVSVARRTRGRPMRAYRCHFCEGYHLSSIRKRSGRR